MIQADGNTQRMVFSQQVPTLPNSVLCQGPTLIQMAGNNNLSKSTPLAAIDPNAMINSQDQVLFHGPIILNQYNSIAEYLAGKGDFANAIKYYEKITSLDPENGAAWTALGHCYLLTDDLQKAFTSYQKALYSLPDVRDPQLWYGIGLLYDKVS
jgi:tetratricopeptide (TPR) repeat protein